MNDKRTLSEFLSQIISLLLSMFMRVNLNMQCQINNERLSFICIFIFRLRKLHNYFNASIIIMMQQYFSASTTIITLLLKLRQIYRINMQKYTIRLTEEQKYVVRDVQVSVIPISCFGFCVLWVGYLWFTPLNERYINFYTCTITISNIALITLTIFFTSSYIFS